jgi:carboxyl-terminal processing protease
MTIQEVNHRRKLTLGLLFTTTVAVVCLCAVVASAVYAGGLVLSARPLPAVSAATEADPASSAKSVTGPSQAPSAPTPTGRTDDPAQSTDAIPAETTQRQLRVFRQMWNIVNDHYIYPDFNGFDWKNARTSAEARIKSGIGDEAFYELMRELIFNLNDNHSSFLSPQEAEEENKAYEGQQKYVGIGVVVETNVEKKYIYIIQVYPGSPAEAAGLKPHDHILSVDGQPTVDTEGQEYDHLMRGPINTTVTLQVRTPGQQPREVAIVRDTINNSEPVTWRLLSANLAGKKKIGYMLVPTFFEEKIAERMRDALKGLMKAGGGRLDGLIVDMRINGGGSLPILTSALGFFSRGGMGRLEDRDSARYTVNVRAERIGNSQTVPLVILIGPLTESYAEVFAGALQGKGRAQLIGQPSAGNIETLLRHDFEDGSVAWIAQETFRLPDGSGWEGVGLQPDTRIEANWDDFTETNDPAIATAIKALQQ